MEIKGKLDLDMEIATEMEVGVKVLLQWADAAASSSVRDGCTWGWGREPGLAPLGPAISPGAGEDLTYSPLNAEPWHSEVCTEPGTKKGR